MRKESHLGFLLLQCPIHALPRDLLLKILTITTLIQTVSNLSLTPLSRFGNAHTHYSDFELTSTIYFVCAHSSRSWLLVKSYPRCGLYFLCLLLSISHVFNQPSPTSRPSRHTSSIPSPPAFAPFRRVALHLVTTNLSCARHAMRSSPPTVVSAAAASQPRSSIPTLTLVRSWPDSMSLIAPVPFIGVLA